MFIIDNAAAAAAQFGNLYCDSAAQFSILLTLKFFGNAAQLSSAAAAADFKCSLDAVHCIIIN
jgi:hypothetical protein